MDSEKLRSLQVLTKEIYAENREFIFDIILFGSSIKGKTKPRDTDIVVVFNQKLPQNKINNMLSLFQNCHSEYVFLEELYREPLWTTIIQEGYSLIHSEFVHSVLGFESYFLFTYDLKNLGKVSKSRFSHALFGRKKDGLLSEIGGKVFGKGCVLVPTEKSEKMRSFLETWKINYTVYRSLLY